MNYDRVYNLTDDILLLLNHSGWQTLVFTGHANEYGTVDIIGVPEKGSGRGVSGMQAFPGFH